MPIISSIIQHSNPYAATVNSDTIRGGFRSAQATASALADLFDNTAAPGSFGNELDLVKQHATITYVTEDDKYYILDDYTAADVAPGTAGSGWIDFRVAIGAASADGAVSLDSTLDANLLNNDAGELSLDTQAANTVFAGPSTGTATEPSFRALVAGDIPDLSSTYLTSTDISSFITLADISVGTDAAASGDGGLAYDNTTGVFTYTPPDLSSYLVSADLDGLITGIGVTEGTNTNEYKIVLTSENANGSYTTTYIDTDDLTFTPGSGSDAGLLNVANLTVAANATITGNLTVAGTVFQTNSEEVNFNDTVLRTNVPTAGTGTNVGAPSAGVTGIEAFAGVASNAFVAGAKLVYDYSADKWKSSTQDAPSTYDNVATLKFNVTDSNTQVTQVSGTTTMSAADEANASSVRSLGAVSKCTIDITSFATDGSGSTNYAPAEAAAGGYPIKHNLGTESVYVFAIKTHDEGTALGDPVPIFCKWVPEDENTVRVTVGITAEDDKYDIIVIG